MSLKAKAITIDGNALDKDGVSGIYITLQDWQKISTSDNSEDRVGQHGRITTATFSRIRTITLEGLIDRVNNPNELVAVQYLENLLCLQGDPSILSPRTLSIKDIYNREWTLSVKVTEPIEFIEGDSTMVGSHWTWRAVLESIGDPYFQEKNEQTATSIESTYGGFSIPFRSPLIMSSTINGAIIIPTGNGVIRPRIIITANGDINAPIIIKNLNTNEIFSLGVSAISGDTIIIDSTTRKCTKNGADVTALRNPGSIFPKVSSSSATTFRVEDADGGSYGSELAVTFYFRNTLS